MKSGLQMLDNLRKVAQRERYSAEKLQAWQSSFLPKLVLDAYDKVPFYREFYKDFTRTELAEIRTPQDLKRLPSIDRAFYRSYPVAGRLANGFDETNTLRTMTSGSSGIVLESFNSRSDLLYLRMIYLNDLLQAGLRPWDRTAFFRLRPFMQHPFERFGLLQFHHIQTDWTLEKQVELVLRAQPTFLTGFPSMIYALMTEMKRRGIVYKKVRNILFGGEKISPAARQELAEYFGAKVSEVYGAVETFTMGRECSQGNMHVHSGDVIVEVEDAQGNSSLTEGEGQAVITRLVAEAMPLIRYKIGDWIELKPNDCSCGVYHSPIIKKIYGRSDDMLRTPDGRLLNGIFLTKHIDSFRSVKQFQITQTDLENIKIKLVIKEADSNLLNEIGTRLKDVHPDFSYQLELTDNIPCDSNGKIKVINSEVGVRI